MVEYVWLRDIATADGQAFEGRIVNAPRLVTNARMGQRHRFERDEIVDWMWVDQASRRIVGNVTACALLSHEAPSDARAAIKQLRLDCDWLQAGP